MSKMTRLQVNVPIKVKEEFEEIASEYGMDLSNAVRYMMIQFNLGEFRPSIASDPKPEKLSKEAAERYDKIVNNILSGKEEVIGPFDNAEDLMKSLNE